MLFLLVILLSILFLNNTRNLVNLLSPKITKFFNILIAFQISNIIDILVLFCLNTILTKKIIFLSRNLLIF